MYDSPATSIHAFGQYIRFEKRYSRNTVMAYETDLSAFSLFLSSVFLLEDPGMADYNMVRSWLAGLKAGGMSSRAINRKISTLKSFFRYLLKTGVITQTPMARVISPKSGSKLPEFVREEEAARLLQLLESHSEDWKTLNARLLITVFYATGMRLSELIQLREGQVDFSRGQVKVLGKGNKERIIPVPATVLTIIREYMEEKRKKFGGEEDYLLVTEKGRKLYPRYAWSLVNHYLGETTTLSRKSPHILRHSFATHLMNNGADLNAVKELLGHSSLASTQVYTHTHIDKLKNIHKKAHPRS